MGQYQTQELQPLAIPKNNSPKEKKQTHKIIHIHNISILEEARLQYYPINKHLIIHEISKHQSLSGYLPPVIIQFNDLSYLLNDEESLEPTHIAVKNYEDYITVTNQIINEGKNESIPLTRKEIAKHGIIQ